MSKADFGQLMSLSWKFRESKIFLLADKWDLFSLLAARPRPAEELADRLQADSRALRIMLDALVAMGLLVKEHNCYRNQELAQIYLVKGKDSYRGDIFKHTSYCWEQWNSLEEVIKTGHGTPQAGLSPDEERERNNAFIWGMDNVGRDKAQRILTKLDVSGFGQMLDLGGGAATYSIAFAKRNPGLQAVVLDLPLTLEVARENIAKHGLQGRISTKEGSYWEIDYGSGYDLVWISQIIHACSQAQCLKLVKKAVASLASGGCLFVHDFLLHEDLTSPFFGALFSVHMLVATEGGRTYSAEEVKQWFARAGLHKLEKIEIDEQSSLVVGVKPKLQSKT